jgi:hypothetical protein
LCRKANRVGLAGEANARKPAGTVPWAPLSDRSHRSVSEVVSAVSSELPGS